MALFPIRPLLKAADSFLATPPPLNAAEHGHNQKHNEIREDLATEHAEEIELVHGLPMCTVSKCAQTDMHYGRGRTDRERESVGEEADTLYMF